MPYKMTRSVRATAITLALATGIAVGGGIAALANGSTAEDTTTSSQAFADGRYEEDLAPHVTLGNGFTAGNWRPETPIRDRPDYLPVVIAGDRLGYVKRADTFEVPFIPLDAAGPVQVDPTEDAAITRQHDRLNKQANRDGEIWVAVYGQDGETVIGKTLIADVSAVE